jgi:hypothetical protein
MREKPRLFCNLCGNLLERIDPDGNCNGYSLQLVKTHTEPHIVAGAKQHYLDHLCVRCHKLLRDAFRSLEKTESGGVDD